MIPFIRTQTGEAVNPALVKHFKIVKKNDNMCMFADDILLLSKPIEYTKVPEEVISIWCKKPWECTTEERDIQEKFRKQQEKADRQVERKIREDFTRRLDSLLDRLYQAKLDNDSLLSGGERPPLDIDC